MKSNISGIVKFYSELKIIFLVSELTCLCVVYKVLIKGCLVIIKETEHIQFYFLH